MHLIVDRLTSVDGLNRILNTSVGGTPTATFAHDARGNLTSSTSGGVTSSYSYNIDNMLVCVAPSPAAGGSGCGPNGASFVYDPLGRLVQSGGNGQPVTRYQYDGLDLVAEYDANGTLLRRYVHGPGVDDPTIWYEGSSVAASNRRFLMADERECVAAFPWRKRQRRSPA